MKWRALEVGPRPRSAPLSEIAPEEGRRGPMSAAEMVGQVTLVCEPNRNRDLRAGGRRLGEEFCCPHDPVRHDIAMRRRDAWRRSARPEVVPGAAGDRGVS